MRLEKMERNALNKLLREESNRLDAPETEYCDLRVPELWRMEDGKIILTYSFMKDMKRTRTTGEQIEKLRAILHEAKTSDRKWDGK